MTKKRTDKPARELSKHQISRWEQAEKRQRLIYATGVFIIIAVLLVVGAGWFMTQFRPLHETVLDINGAKYNMSYYIKMLTFIGKGNDPQSLPYLTSYASNMIEQNTLIYQGAAQLGVTVDDAAVKAELKKQSLSSDYYDVARAQLLIEKLKTNEYFTSKVPKTAPQAKIMAMFLESEAQANEVRAKLDAGESFEDLAASLSLDSYTKTNKGNLGMHPEDIFPGLVGSSVPSDYAFASEKDSLSQPREDADKTKQLGYWLVKVAADEQNNADQVHVWAMLLSSQQEANDVKARLATDDFATIAKEKSELNQVQENGGDLGMLLKGQLPKDVEDFVFGTDPDILSEPIKDDSINTTGGSWIIKVAEKADDKELTVEDSDTLMGQQLNAWLTVLQGTAAINNTLDDAKIQFAIEQALKALGG